MPPYLFRTGAEPLASHIADVLEMGQFMNLMNMRTKTDLTAWEVSGLQHLHTSLRMHMRPTNTVSGKLCYENMKKHMKHLDERTRKRRLDDSRAQVLSAAQVLSPPKSARPMLGPIARTAATASSSGAGTSSDVEVMEVEEVTVENDTPQRIPRIERVQEVD